MAGCVSYKEQLIFISGGYNKHEASNHVLQFDPLNENIGYEILPNLMFHRAGHIMTIVNVNDEDRLLVIGKLMVKYTGWAQSNRSSIQTVFIILFIQVVMTILTMVESSGKLKCLMLAWRDG